MESNVTATYAAAGRHGNGAGQVRGREITSASVFYVYTRPGPANCSKSEETVVLRLIYIRQQGTVRENQHRPDYGSP